VGESTNRVPKMGDSRFIQSEFAWGNKNQGFSFTYTWNERTKPETGFRTLYIL